MVTKATRLYRYLNGLDQDNHDKRAEHIMQQNLDGLTVGPANRNSVKEILATHFEAVEAEERGRCARECDDRADMIENHTYQDSATRLAAEMLRKAAAAIRKGE